MSKSIKLIFLCLTAISGLTVAGPATAETHVNYADRLLESLADQLAETDPNENPISALLLAERVYFLSHETAKQERIIEVLQELYDRTTHQELKAEIGQFLFQKARLLKDYETVGRLFAELGYAEGWQVTAPLKQDLDPDPREFIRQKQTEGLDRTVSRHTVYAHGEEGYLSRGVGHFGYFGADAAIYPNQLIGAVFQTWIEAPAKGTYRIGLGWNHKISLWVDRNKLFHERRDQDPHPDQEVLHVELGKGIHLITIYLETASDDPRTGFYARFTDLEGNPLKSSVDHRGRVPRRKVATTSSNETSLLQAARAGSSAELAGTMLIKERRYLEGEGTIAELFGRAFADRPSRLVTEKMLSLTKDPNERRKILDEFISRAGEVDAAPLDLAWANMQLGQIALDLNRFWEARHYVKEAREAAPNYWPADILENNTFTGMGLTGEALRHTSELNRKYPGVPWIMMDLADLYTAMDFYRESETVTDDILKIRAGNGKFAQRKVELLKRRGDVEALAAFYKSLREDSPYSISTITGYAGFLGANRRFSEAEQVLSDALKQFPENPYLLESMGKLKLRQGDASGLEFLEEALALRPQNPELENIIALTKSDNTKFYEPYKIETAPDVEPLEISPIIINIDNTVVKLAPNGQASTFRQMEWEIIDEQGIVELPGYSFSYAPLREKVEILKAELYRDGQTILLTNFGRTRISDPRYRMYYDLLAYQIAFPTLEVGDRIRIEYRIDDTHQTNIFGNYFGDLIYFASENPVRYYGYTLIAPQDMALYHHVDRMEPNHRVLEEGDKKVYRWEMERVSPYEAETFMPGLEAYLPSLRVSTFSDWQDMAKWYAELIRNQLKLDHETKEIVRDLVAGVDDRLEIVKRIHEYVITNTRYVALEFGIHGYKPYEVNSVCSRQFGDCKDKASLMVAMMREAGVPAEIAIVRTTDKGDVHPFPAMLAYFNHAIAYVPEFDLYLDGTAEFSGINELPEMDQGALTLRVDENGKGTLTHIPILEDNYQGYSLNVDIQSNGTAEVEGEISVKGVVTPDLRQYLTIEEKLQQNTQALLTDMVPGLDIREADRQGKALNEPITLRFKGVSNGLLQQREGLLRLPLNILNNQLTQHFAPNARRKFPLEFGPPKTRRVRLQIDTPPGWQIRQVPDPLEVEDENFKVAIRFETEEDGRFNIDYQVDFKTHRVEPSDYDALRRMMQAHDRILDKAIDFVGQP